MTHYRDHMIEIVPIEPDHIESFHRTLVALYKKIGSVAEGLQRNAFKVDGQYANLVMMAVLFEG